MQLTSSAVRDADGNVLEASDSFCAMLGYSREEIIGANVSLRDAKWSPQELKRELAEQMAKEGPSLFETRHRRRDGSFLDVEVTGQSLELDGKPALFNSARDITEHKRAQPAFARSSSSWPPWMSWAGCSTGCSATVNRAQNRRRELRVRYGNRARHLIIPLRRAAHRQATDGRLASASMPEKADSDTLG